LDEASLSLAELRDGVGLAFCMEADVRTDIASGALVRVLEDWTPSFGDLCLYYSGRRHASAALKAFVALARELGSQK
jgi:DNA-binding transcriptional LysR family regulator